MERGEVSSEGPFPKLAKAASGSVARVDATNVNLEPDGLIREQDRYLPIANVIRIMRQVLPFHAKISDDAKETIQECTSEFISFITGEANDHCQKEQRKTINGDDLIWAMTKLGFDDYAGPLSVYLARYRELERAKSQRREPVAKRPVMGVPYGPMPVMHMGMNQRLFDATAPGALDGLYNYMNGYGAGSSSPQGPLPDYDPFGRFK